MPAIKWGNKRKERVIKKYSLEREITVTQCGFIPHPTIEMASAIPDGLIGDGGLIKVKYSQPTTHVRFLLDGKIKPEYILQMPFQMACTGRKWCDFVSYNLWLKGQHTHLCIKIQRISRDDEQIERINKAVKTFLEEIKQKMQIFIQAA
ncbi:hypothetical protein GGR10_001069 [Bartonella chomelii]|uniref:YqaJ viral recombinase domain-containing protein n=1 Tax=Bartonella chomelii TaxID=236402 RepID=A0ABR6E6F1_9HYPH|nr:hypothetical protein [Bartonella chomelii]